MIDIESLEKLLTKAQADAVLSVKDRHYGVARSNWKHALEIAGPELLAELRELRERKNTIEQRYAENNIAMARHTSRIMAERDAAVAKLATASAEAFEKAAQCVAYVSGLFESEAERIAARSLIPYIRALAVNGGK
jgi:hypothetical protein